MTRKLVIVFIVLILCFYSLTLSFFGERGIIANNQLKKQLKENEYELDRRKVEIENLKLRKQELSTEDGLRSAAINLGYQVDGDDVYVFQSDGSGEAVPVGASASDSGKQVPSFNPWSMGFCLLISFCLSFIITLIIWLFSRSKGQDDDSQQEKPGDTGNNFDFD